MAEIRMWPTPRAHESGDYTYDRGDKTKPRLTLSGTVRRWPTPTSSRKDIDTLERARFSGTELRRKKEAERPYQKQNGGMLNPDFVEFLMGWPRGWSALAPLISRDLMGYQSRMEIRRDAERRSDQALSILPKGDEEKAVYWSAGRHGNLQETKVLQPALHGPSDDQEAGREKRLDVAGQKIPQSTMRDLWEDTPSGGPSQKQRSQRQFTRELDDAVFILSHDMALAEWEDHVEKRFGLCNLWDACKEIGVLSKALPTLQEVWRSLSDEEKDWITVRLDTRNRWHSEWPRVPRVVSGVPDRVNRLKALGNGQVSLCVAAVWKLLTP